MRVFVDTNVVIDVLARRGKFYAPARALFDRFETREHEGVVSAVTIATASFLLSRPSGAVDVRATLLKLRTLVGVSAVDERAVDLALADARFADIEDGLQHFSAMAAPCQVIVTRDPKGFAASALPVYDPAAFLALSPAP